MSSQASSQRTTVATLRKMKREGRRIVCLTAYDAAFAAVLDGAGVDVVLVGDSLGMVIQGHESTVPVTLDDVVYHTACAARGCSRALLVADLPFLSYATPEQALQSAARCLQQGRAQAVKLEGGERQVATVRRLTDNGIPVCAHLGLNPQWVHKLGGYRVQGRGDEAADQMRADALALEAAGADLLILECVPVALAAEITRSLQIPVIGIGAGAECDGQILVLHDILGITPGRLPRFARNFLDGAGSVQAAVARYAEAVRNGSFPADEHTFG
jgi:3-methyl-2-oxobutanoate hydroxymethyltransferase